MADLYKLAKNTLFNNFKFNIKNQTKKCPPKTKTQNQNP